MTEVSSWSPTDASNNLTPPDGWPEGMQPSGVNDVGRMMMGAIRRWYNTVSAGIANCLPLSGGTLIGPLGATSISASGDIFGRNLTASVAVYSPLVSSSGGITASGAISATGNIAGGSISTTGNLSGAYIVSNGAVDAATSMGAPIIIAHSQLTSEGSLSVTGGATVGTNLTVSGAISAGGNIAGGSISTTGNLSGAYIVSSGAVDAATSMGAPIIIAHSQLTSEGTLSVTGGATVGALSVTGAATVGSLSTTGVATVGSLSTTGGATVGGNLTVSATVNTNNYQLAGVTFGTHGVDAAGPVHSICDSGGVPAIDMYGANGTYYRCGNAHTFTNRAATVNIARFQVTDGVCQNATGSWSTFSDRALKENLTDYTAGLSAVLQLSPKSFNYMAGKNPFDVGGGTYYGLVAQDVEPILPEMVSTDDEGIALLQPTHLVYVLLNAVKELEARLAQVENRGG